MGTFRRLVPDVAIDVRCVVAPPHRTDASLGPIGAVRKRLRMLDVVRRQTRGHPQQNRGQVRPSTAPRLHTLPA